MNSAVGRIRPYAFLPLYVAYVFLWHARLQGVPACICTLQQGVGWAFLGLLYTHSATVSGSGIEKHCSDRQGMYVGGS